MICPYCNRMINGNPKFCPGCGANLASAQRPQYQRPQYQQPQYQQPQYQQPQYQQPQYQQPQYQQTYGTPYGGYPAANPNAGGSALLGLVVYAVILAISLIGIFMFDFLTVSVKYEGRKASNGVSLSEMQDVAQLGFDAMNDYDVYYNHSEADTGMDVLNILFVGGAGLFTVLAVICLILAVTKLGRGDCAGVWRNLGRASVMSMIGLLSPIILGAICVWATRESLDSAYGAELSRYMNYGIGIWPVLLCITCLVLAVTASNMRRKCQ